MSVKIGVLGLGQFGAQFVKLFHNHPAVSRLAICDIETERLKQFIEDPALNKLAPQDAFTSYNEMLRAGLDAIVVMSQPWLHAEQCVKALETGHSVYSAVPVMMLPGCDENLEWCDRLVNTVKKAGRHYMLGETTYYRAEAMFCRRKAAEGVFGDFIYSEGQYMHPFDWKVCDLRQVMKGRFSGIPGKAYLKEINDYAARGIRSGPMLYPTHSVSGPMSVMSTHAKKVSCFGTRPFTEDSYFEDYRDAFANETAIFQMSNGSTMRILEHREGPMETESFMVHGTKANFGYKHSNFLHLKENEKNSLSYSEKEMRDPLPAEVLEAFMNKKNGSKVTHSDTINDFTGVFKAHGGSHPYLVHEFVDSVDKNRIPSINVWEAVRYMAAGVMAHRSALKDGECLDIPDWGDAPMDESK